MTFSLKSYLESLVLVWEIKASNGFKMWPNRDETSALERFWSWAICVSCRDSRDMERDCCFGTILPTATKTD